MGTRCLCLEGLVSLCVCSPGGSLNFFRTKMNILCADAFYAPASPKSADNHGKGWPFAIFKYSIGIPEISILRDRCHFMEIPSIRIISPGELWRLGLKNARPHS